jgi:hypothetical protein
MRNARVIQNADDQLKSGRIEVLSDDDQKILYENCKVAFSYKIDLGPASQEVGIVNS